MSERDSDDEYDRTVDDSGRGADDDRATSRDPNAAGDRGVTGDPDATGRSTTAGDPDTPGGFETNPGGRGKWISAVIGLLGLWMILQAVLLDLTAGQFWNDVIVGVLLVVVGGYNYYRRADERLGNIGAATLAALVGLWLVAAPFVFGAGETAGEAAFWNDVVVGLLALVLGAFSAYRGRSRRRAATRTA